MSRKYGSSMTNILDIHSEWLEANGYTLRVKKKKQNSTIQSTSDAPQPTREIAKIKSTSEDTSYLTLEARTF